MAVPKSSLYKHADLWASSTCATPTCDKNEKTFTINDPLLFTEEILHLVFWWARMISSSVGLVFGGFMFVDVLKFYFQLLFLQLLVLTFLLLLRCCLQLHTFAFAALLLALFFFFLLFLLLICLICLRCVCCLCSFWHVLHLHHYHHHHHHHPHHNPYI